MDHNLFHYIWRHSKRDQLAILFLVLSALPFYFISLDLPKQIVNDAIQGGAFPNPDSTQPVARLELPDALGGLVLFGGFEVERIPFLYYLSGLFLLLVCINGLFKYQINTEKGRLGERMLRRMRFELFDRILRFQPSHFRKVKQAELATIIKDEVEPLGGFIGDAFSQPIFQGGMAATAMVFIMVQSVYLGTVALAIVLVQALIIPKLREPIRRLGKKRQIASRHLAGRIAEVVEGINEVHVNDTSNYERAEITNRLSEIFWIRFEIYQRKFFVKFLNNFLAQFTPFLFYAIGGYFAIRGSLDVGQLVAVLVAYKDLPAPIKELINWDQQRLDSQVKYEQVIEQFDIEDIIDPKLQDPTLGLDRPLEGEIVLSNATAIDDMQEKVVDGVYAQLPLRGSIAIVGNGKGHTQLAQLLVRLIQLHQGQVEIAGYSLTEIPSAVIGRRAAYVGQDAYFFPMSVRDNLLYASRHRLIRPSERVSERRWKVEEMEARRTGNSVDDLLGEWIDLEEIGAASPDVVTKRVIEVLDRVRMSEDIYQLGLRGRIDPDNDRETADLLLAARGTVGERMAAEGLSDLIETFDPEAYTLNASIADNLLFGMPTDARLSHDMLVRNTHFIDVLDRTGLREDLEKMGFEIAENMVEIFSDLDPGNALFEQYSFISAEELPLYRTMTTRARRSGIDSLSAQERQQLLALSLDYEEARHRLGLIDATLRQKVVAARKAFRETLPADMESAIAFLDPEAYNKQSSILDNLLFGRVAYGRAGARERVEDVVTSVLSDAGLRQRVLEIGLDYNVGGGGRRLSASQRQRLALARAMLRQPDLLIVNEALAVVDARLQERIITAVLDSRQDQGTIFVLARPELVGLFNTVLVFDGAKLVERGEPAELKQEGRKLHALLNPA